MVQIFPRSCQVLPAAFQTNERAIGVAIWITRVLAGEAGLRLRVEGQIVGDWCGVLERESRACCGRGREVSLDLAGVSFVDPRGLETLRRLQSSGLRLVEVPPLIAASLKDS